MNIKYIIINLLKRLRQGRMVKQRIAPETLQPEIMAAVMQEVKFLRREHSVDVRELASDEIPTIPQQVHKEV